MNRPSPALAAALLLISGGMGLSPARIERDVWDPPIRREPATPPSPEKPRAIHKPARSPAEVERRKKRKAARKSRKGRK